MVLDKPQVRGYYFEEIIRTLMRKSNFIDVQTGNIAGRGADHQIDSYGTFAFMIPFVYPVRLISEAKWYRGKVGLPIVRNFVGVIKDITENYFVPRDTSEVPLKLLQERYTDCGVCFSATGFSSDAQNYAWAHGIYLIPFENNTILNPILERVLDILTKENKWDTLSSKDDVIKIAKDHFIRYNLMDQLHAYLGILDGIYPVYIISDGPLKFSSETADEVGTDSEYSATKEGRKETQESIRFRFSFKNRRFEFTVPRLMGTKLIDAIENTYAKGQEGRGEPFSYVEIPFKIEEKRDNKMVSFRRIFKMNLTLPDKNSLIEKLKPPRAS